MMRDFHQFVAFLLGLSVGALPLVDFLLLMGFIRFVFPSRLHDLSRLLYDWILPLITCILAAGILLWGMLYAYSGSLGRITFSFGIFLALLLSTLPAPLLFIYWSQHRYHDGLEHKDPA
ncbi:hypothetical protein [Ktedonobacter racemifer]|uniref:Uncharacterized protein n=1 Tax=Ktedonobacter racemifer DSM 44963 TaxID=485913 RepID=D6TVP0_KTERA|nr:hypothetical protein [Ktedonobacter racemifer]EFH84273.1 hypothetical protein Krac_5298 [Ktedonobacter racemifer DSM 44963]